MHSYLPRSLLRSVQSFVFRSTGQLSAIVLGRQAPGDVLTDGLQVTAGFRCDDGLVHSGEELDLVWGKVLIVRCTMGKKIKYL